MKQYDSYKDSGVQWIGSIPRHWDVGRLKFTGSFGNGLTYSPDDVTDSNGILVLRSSNIQSNHLVFDDCVYVKHVNKELIVEEGDIIICSRNGSASLVGKCAYIETSLNATFGAFMMRYKPSIFSRFAYYLFQSATDYYKGLFSTTTINQLTSGIIDQMVVPYLPLPEQQAIATYLDKKSAAIDKAITTQQKRIELLQELRRNIITQAVTRGINPNAPMKDSGVQWIGMVPEHWDVKKIKFCGRICSGDSISNELVKDSGTYEVYGGNGFIGYTDSYNIETDKIIIGRVGALCGNIHISRGKRFISDNSLIFSPHKTTSLDYLAFFMIAADLNKLNTSSAQPLITGTKVMAVVIPVPPLSEQIEIVSFIEKQTSRIDKSIAKAEREITLLQELKQSIITEVVTGKRKVC